MTEYIKREDVYLALNSHYFTGELSLRETIDSVPFADVRPVIYGEWEYVSFMTVRCSNCKETFHELEADNFCPNCGADMRGENQ